MDKVKMMVIMKVIAPMKRTAALGTKKIQKINPKEFGIRNVE